MTVAEFMASKHFAKGFWPRVVIAVLGFAITLCAIAVYFGEDIVGPTVREPTESLMQELETAFVAYYTDYGSLPPSSENYLLVETFRGGNPLKKVYFSPKANQISANLEYIDRWGTPMRFTFKSKDDPMTVLIISAGPDKIFGTADDIANQ